MGISVTAATFDLARIFGPAEVPEGLVFRPGAGLRVVQKSRGVRRKPRQELVSFDQFLARERVARRSK